jgi:hypothetical protein
VKRRALWALLLGATIAGWAGASWLLVPVLFGGLMWPCLRALAPDEPAPLKLAYFAVLLSPPAAVCVWMLGQVALPTGFEYHAQLVLGVPFVAALWKGWPSPPRQPVGRGQLFVLGLSVVFAAWVAWTLQRGAMARVSYHGLLHAAIAESSGASMPPENPWLAGREIGYYWVWQAMGAALGDWLHLAPTRALAWLNVWAALVLPIGLYFWVAGFRGTAEATPGMQAKLGARDGLGVALGLVGLNVLGGWVWLGRGAPLDAPLDSLEVLANLRALIFGAIDPRVAWGPSKFGNLSSYPVSLSLVVGGLLAGSHAVAAAWRRVGDELASGSTVAALQQRVARAWSVLAGLSLGAAFVVNPLIGAIGYVAVGLVALVRRQTFLLVALGLTALPGVLEVLAAGHQREATSVALAVGGARLAAVVWPLLPLVLGAALAFTARRRVTAGFWWVAMVGAGASMVVAVVAVLPEANEYKFVRTAALFLSPLAAVGWWKAWTDGGAKRWVAHGLLVFWALGAGAASVPGLASYAALARLDAPIDESQGELNATGDSDVAQAMRFLRRASAAAQTAGQPRPLLIVAPPASGALGWEFEGMTLDQADNLQGFSAAALSGCSLLADRSSYLVNADPQWATQLNLVRSLYAGVPQAVPALIRRLREPDMASRAHYLMVEGGNVDPALLTALNWQECWRAGQVALWIDPQTR